MSEDLGHIYAGDIAGAKVTEAPRSNSVTGYGRKLPTGYMLQDHNSTWRRVYVANYGNAGSSYVLIGGKMHFLSPGAELIIETIRDGGALQGALDLMAEWPDFVKDAEHLDRRPVLYALWHGGANYGPSYAPEHTEIFDSLQAVKDELQARYGLGRAHIRHLDGTTEDTGTPAVDEYSYFTVWSHGDGTEHPDYGTRVYFGPRGGIRVENI